jgi:hypothetical protein
LCGLCGNDETLQRVSKRIYRCPRKNILKITNHIT